MSDETDIDSLARRYLEIWRDQLSVMASDPETIDTLSRAFTTFGQAGAQQAANPASLFPWMSGMSGMSGMPGMAGNSTPGSSEGAPDFNAVFRAFSSQVAGASGATAAAAQPDDSGEYISELERRIAALEERVAGLEPGPRKSRGKTSRRAEKNKS